MVNKTQTIPHTLLGEGLHTTSTNTFWLDIANYKLFMQSTRNRDANCYSLPEQASAIWKVENDLVYLAAESGVVSFDVSNETWDVVAPFTSKNSSMRSNDGCYFNNGFLFGTMQKEPSNKAGTLYYYKDSVLHCLDEPIAIPNTFIQLSADTVLISDSFEQITYQYQLSQCGTQVLSKGVWLDLSNTSYTPDGGTIGKDGLIYIAMWDDASIHVFDQNANFIKKIPVNALRPTNCALSIDESKLYITTATEGLTDLQLKQYQDSGKLITKSPKI